METVESSSGLRQRTPSCPQEATRRSMIASCTTLVGTPIVVMHSKASAEMGTRIFSWEMTAGVSASHRRTARLRRRSRAGGWRTGGGPQPHVAGRRWRAGGHRAILLTRCKHDRALRPRLDRPESRRRERSRRPRSRDCGRAVLVAEAHSCVGITKSPEDAFGGRWRPFVPRALRVSCPRGPDVLGARSEKQVAAPAVVDRRDRGRILTVPASESRRSTLGRARAAPRVPAGLPNRSVAGFRRRGRSVGRAARRSVSAQARGRGPIGSSSARRVRRLGK